MWQHAANIILGLLLIALSLICALLGALRFILIASFAGAGVAVTCLACWGLYDELEHEQNEPPSGM